MVLIFLSSCIIPPLFNTAAMPADTIQVSTATALSRGFAEAHRTAPVTTRDAKKIPKAASPAKVVFWRPTEAMSDLEASPPRVNKNNDPREPLPTLTRSSRYGVDSWTELLGPK